jgi:hypothetical protein
MTPSRDGEFHWVSGPRKYDLDDLGAYPVFDQLQTMRRSVLRAGPEERRNSMRPGGLSIAQEQRLLLDRVYEQTAAQLLQLGAK